MALNVSNHYVWHSQMNDILRLANDLKENAVQVDVYLRALGNKDWNDEAHHHQTIALPAHRLMLAAASPFLSKVLCEHYAEHRDTCVHVSIPNVSHKTLQYILDFIYCGSLDISLSAQNKVLEAAKVLQISTLIGYIEGAVKDSTGQPEFQGVKAGQEKMDDVIVHPKWRRKKKQPFHVKPKVKGTLDAYSGSNRNDQVTAFVKETKIHQYKPHRRKIKSKYDSDTYELSLPVIGGFESKCSEVENKNKRHKKSFVSKKEDPSIISSKLFKSSGTNLQTTEGNIKESEFAKIVELSPPEKKDDPEFKSIHHDPLKPVVSSLTLQSPSSLSVGSSDVMSNLFSTDTSYIQGNSEIPCTSYIESPASSSGISKKLYPSPIVSSNFSVVQQMSELPGPSVTFSRGALESNSLKYLPDICRAPEVTRHPSNSGNDEDEAEEEDGLFKLQFLLKDCEDFPETVTHHISSSLRNHNSGVEVKLEEPAAGLDIRQWISEEVKSPEVPEEALDDNGDSDVGNLQNQAVTEVVKSNTSENPSKKKSCDDLEKNPHECHLCGKGYSSGQSLKAHMKNTHKEAKQMCKYCGKMFKRRCDLYDHERRHNKASLPCKMCGKTFKLKKDLDAHVRTHVGGKRYTCDQCNKELTSYRNLRDHIAGVHEKLRSYACHMCNKTYAKSRALQIHIRSVHTGERPFKCEICGKTFCNPSLLKAHEVSHTGQQNYSCKVCQRKFSQYCNMITHQRVHSNERPFVCTICKEGYKTRESLRKHKWIHTGLKPLRCRHCSKEYRIKESFERHMLKCHDEVVHLPQIYFEMSEKVAVESTSDDMNHGNIKILRNINECENEKVPTSSMKLENEMANNVQEPESISTATLPENIVPVVQFVGEITQGGSTAIQLDESGSSHLHLNPETVQINYPILSANNSEVEDDNTSLANITGGIPEGSELSTPIESLLQVTLPGTNRSVLMTEDGKVNIILDC